MSPTARSLKCLKDDGWIAQVVERFCPYSRKRIDLFGVIDIVAIHPDRPGVFGIQATTSSNQSARIKKCLASESARIWIKTGNYLQVWGWSKKKIKRGGIAVRWSVNKNIVSWKGEQ
tara:strand:+ start:11147 stop:11497 length:351 start_codon:yes stop_codon:yes gene_type:complete